MDNSATHFSSRKKPGTPDSLELYMSALKTHMSCQVLTVVCLSSEEDIFEKIIAEYFLDGGCFHF